MFILRTLQWVRGTGTASARRSARNRDELLKVEPGFLYPAPSRLNVLQALRSE